MSTAAKMEELGPNMEIDSSTSELEDCWNYTCNNCKRLVETRYHCIVCDDFDLCVQCFVKNPHPHKMEKLGLDLDDELLASEQNKANPQEARKLSIQRCIQSLVHACQCRDPNCRLPSCEKMKRVVQHTKICKRKTNGGCPICKQLIALCCYHAKHCQETKCPVPFCLNIKHKLKQPQLQQRLQQAQLLRRRMAVMNTRRTVPTGHNAVTAGISQGVIISHQRSRRLKSQQQQQPRMSGGIVSGTASASENPLVGVAAQKSALQQLLVVLKSPNTPEQQAQIIHILKSNPPLLAAFIKQRQEFLRARAVIQTARTSQGPGEVMEPEEPRSVDELQQMMSQLYLNNSGDQLQQMISEVFPYSSSSFE